MDSTHNSHGGIELAEAVNRAYLAGQTDYSIEPIVLADTDGNPIGRIQDGDAVIFCLRRGEREVQLTEAFVDPEIGGFPRAAFNNLPFVILTRYHEKFNHLPVAFAPTRIKDSLAEVISRCGMKQLHVSESEKFSHVTFFFNGGNNQPFVGEKDIRIPSLRCKATDFVPELSLPQVIDEVIRGIHEGYQLIVTNFANGDVIGHTQNRGAKLKCAEIIDAQLQLAVEQALAAGYIVLITADHGNLELMLNSDGSQNVSHTTNPVQLILVSDTRVKNITLQPGNLADLAPTILSIYGISPPGVMTGKNLISGPEEIQSKKVLLVILDGWGIGKNDQTNPIYLASTPNWDKLLREYPSTQLNASGENVGLLIGKAGNSEAGHMNIGAGRVIPQDDVRLDAAMQDGSFRDNEVFRETLDGVMQRQSSLHLIGLLSDKSSHGTILYPLELVHIAKERGLPRVYLHIIFDGRSTQPGSAPAMLHKLEGQISEIGIGKIVTGIGRGIALDRDGDYQKTRRAYEAMVFGIGEKCCLPRNRLGEAEKQVNQGG